ncbi:MAG TPA: hypothetical protein VK158_06740 [Acidobacteriota bacterium]|nr:hypothetical protein [Acidobacteriota bacterium]
MDKPLVHRAWGNFAFFAYIVCVFGISLLSRSDIFSVFVGTSAIILTVLLVWLLGQNAVDAHKYRMASLVVPLFPITAFFMLWKSNVSAFVSTMDIDALIPIQIVCSYILVLLSWSFIDSPKKATATHHAHQHHTPAVQQQPSITAEQLARKYAIAAQQKELYAQQVKEELSSAQNASLPLQQELEYKEKIASLEASMQHAKDEAAHAKERNEEYQNHIHKLQDSVAKLQDKLEVSSQNFSTRLRSIEDKCKAINFVIGRVYSDKNGGNAQMREQLNINRELYNSFSQMTSDITSENAAKISAVIKKINDKLLALEQPESTYVSAKKVKRSGEDTVLEVLSKNDDDPVLDYFVEAKEICTKMLEYLGRIA